jgi:hypothetical protein
MPLTLRPTGLSGNPDANHWSIYEDGIAFGTVGVGLFKREWLLG